MKFPRSIWKLFADIVDANADKTKYQMDVIPFYMLFID